MKLVGALSTRDDVDASISLLDAGFRPKPALFVIATSAPRDALVQQHVREVSEDRKGRGLCPVAPMFWEDLCAELTGRPDLLRKHYPQWGAGGSGDQITMNVGTNFGHVIGKQVVNGRVDRHVMGRTFPGHMVPRLRARAVPVITVEAIGMMVDQETANFALEILGLLDILKLPILQNSPNICNVPGRHPPLVIRSVAPPGDASDPLLVLAEWFRGQGFSPTYIPGSVSNLICVGPP